MFPDFPQRNTHTAPPAQVIPSPAPAVFSGVLDKPHLHSSTDRKVKHTYASYRRECIPELDLPDDLAGVNDGDLDAYRPITRPGTSQSSKSWTLSIPISTPPDLPNPTLESLNYDISYAAYSAGSAFVQTDIVLSDGLDIIEGIITDSTQLNFYSHYDDEKNGGSTEGYAPPTLDETVASHLSSRPSFKAPDISGWCHYVDHQQIFPHDARVGGTFCDADSIIGSHSRSSPCHIYLFFQVYESCCVGSLRSIDLNVTATWKDGGEAGVIDEKVKDIDEMRKEIERLIVAKKGAEMMIKRLEESTRKAVEEVEERKEGLKEWEERLLAIEKRVKETGGPGVLKETSGRGKRDRDTQVDAENAILKVQVEIQKFKEEVKRHKRDETETWERMETERRNQMEAEKRERMEIQKMLHKELERYRREEAERGARIEAEREGERIEIQKMLHKELEQYRREGAERGARIEAEREETERKMRLMLREEIEKERKEHKVREEAEQKAKEEAEQRAKEEVMRKKRAKLPKTRREAPDIATGELSEHIRSVAESMGLECNGMFPWSKGPHGYACTAKDESHCLHFVTFSDLGID